MSSGKTTVYVLLHGGSRFPCALDASSDITLGALKAAVASTVQRPAASFSLVRKGQAMHGDDSVVVPIKEGDTFLLAPIRKAPPPNLVTAALQAQSSPSTRSSRTAEGSDDDDDEGPMQLPANAPRWEHAVVAAIQRRVHSPLLLDWVILIRPYRFLVLVAFILGCYVSSRLSLGPIYILLSILALILTNLGKRRPGEASAYSIFNPGTRALPGQLNADMVDRQFRSGAGFA